MRTLLSDPTGKVAQLGPPESLPLSIKPHCAPAAKRLFLSGWLAAIGHRRCVPTVKVVPWTQPIASATFAIGRSRIAEARTNRPPLALPPPAPTLPPRPAPRA